MIVGLMVLAFAGCLALSWWATGRLIPWLAAHGVLDRPNERSSHAVPVPRGGGLAPVAVTLAAWIVLGWIGGLAGATVAITLGAAILAGLGWLDDRRGLSRRARLAAQALIAAVGVATLPPGSVFQDLLPAWAEAAAVGLVWLWFINLTNFMDGADGLAPGHTAIVAFGAALIAALGHAHLTIVWCALALAGAALGFLRWNRPPAKVFLGDAGSVPLGFMTGWLLLTLAASGAWVAAVILPLSFVADATTTLLMRAARGEAFWRPHREHAYQLALRAGRTHAWVTARVLVLDLWLVALAFASLIGGPMTWLALGLAVVSVAGTLWYFRAASTDGRP